jgi:hypothetical protein
MEDESALGDVGFPTSRKEKMRRTDNKTRARWHRDMEIFWSLTQQLLILRK